MKLKNLFILTTVHAAFSFCICSGGAPIHVEGGKENPPIPASLSGFSGEVAQAIEYDLFVQGFSFVDAASAQYQISGSNNGNVQGRVTDPHNKSTLLSK